MLIFASYTSGLAGSDGAITCSFYTSVAAALRVAMPNQIATAQVHKPAEENLSAVLIRD